MHLLIVDDCKLGTLKLQLIGKSIAFKLCSHIHVDINNLADITSYLHQLDKTAVFNLGLLLGLGYERLKAMMDTPTFLQDMLAGWLQKVDRVLNIGVPTWRRLAEALRDPRVGQIGLALEVEQNKQ